MREIEFRGMRKDNREWVYGSLVNNLFFKKGTKDAVCYIIDSQKMGYDSWEDIAELIEDYEVIPETVGQWTGLTDINGQKIYEGDVVRVWGGTNHNGMFEYDKTFGIGNMSVRYLDITNAEYVEVVGNIHEEGK